ncbi:hypothetical protein ACFLWY_02685 [Chloroflexota bacterium]
MATQRKSFWHNYDFTVKPYERWRHIFRIPFSYLFFGTGQLIALSLHARPLKYACAETVDGKWCIQNLETMEVVGSESFQRDVSPKKKFEDVKIITDRVIEFPGKYVVELELNEQDGMCPTVARCFSFSVVERVDYQMHLLTLFAITVSVIALVVAIVAIFLGVD